MGIFNRILTFFRYLLRGSPSAVVPPAPPKPVFPEEVRGIHGVLDVPALLLREDDRVVLSVDVYFPDMPSWLEWDVDAATLSVVQMGGAMSQLALTLPPEDAVAFEAVRRVLLVARESKEFGVEDKLIHYISLIVRRLSV